MTSFLTMGLWFAGGILLWIIDAFLMTLGGSQIGFVQGLWAEASWLHILLRLLLSGFCFWQAVRSYRAMRMQAQPFKENFFHEKLYTNAFNRHQKQNQDDFFNGSAESHNKSGRLLYDSLLLADYFKMSEEEKDKLRILCYCYDIGLVGLPGWLLRKENILNMQEQMLWDQHLKIGSEIAFSIAPLAPAGEYIYYHKEYFNGGGIHGLKGKRIPLACRIFQTAWMYDCMLYPALGIKPLVCADALLELAYYSGSALDPEVVDAFIKLMGNGTVLSDNKSGIFSWQ